MPNLDNLVIRYRSGEGLAPLAREAGIDPTTLHRRFIDLGVHVRGRSEAEKMKWARRKERTDYGEVVLRQCSAAWDGSRRKVYTYAERVKRAKAMSCTTTGARLGKHERELIDALADRGIRAEWQTPCGPYCLDLTLNEDRVAVEVIRYALSLKGRKMHSLRTERVEHIFNSGWALLVVDGKPGRRSVSNGGTKPIDRFDVDWVSEKVIAFRDTIRALPTAIRVYGVSRCYPQSRSTASPKFNNATRVPGF